MKAGRIVIFLILFVDLAGWTQDVDTLAVLEPLETVLNTTSEIIDDMILSDSLEQQKIQITFVKKKVEYGPDSTYFNVCKVTNKTSETVEGEFRVRIPIGWGLIGDPSKIIQLKPGETKIFPVRLTISSEAVGGVAYTVDASISSNEGIYSGATYIKIPLTSEWEMYVDRHTIYFNEYFDEQEFNVTIKNKGNAEELVKLDFTIGKLLEIEGQKEEEVYVLVPAYTDTILTYKVKRSSLNEDEVYSYKQIWNESLIGVTAQSGLGERYGESIHFTDLDNQYIHQRQETASPLNLDLSVYNLLSTVQPRVNASLFGEIQFRGDHDLGYIFQARNLFYASYGFENYFQAANNLTFNVNYQWRDKIRAQLGEINNYSMHSLRGWGVKGSYNFDKNTKISASYITGKYYPMWGTNLRFDSRFKKIGFHVGATYEENGYLFYDAISPELGISFPVAKNHLFRFVAMGTQSVYDQNQGVGSPLDTTVLGFSYTASYTGMVKKFRFGVNTRNDQFNYLRVRPGHRVTGYVRYMINDKSRINGTAQFNSIEASKLLFNSYYNGSYNGQQIYRLSYSNRVTNKISFETGPTGRILNRFQIDTNAVVISDFTNYFVGVYTLTRIRFDQFKMLTPTLSAGATSFRDHLADADTLSTMPTVNLGISYTARSWGASANYIYGPNFFLTQGFFDYDITSFETIHFRGHFARFMNKRKIKFTAYGNYYLRLPTNRQNFAVSARFDFYLPKGWSAYVTGNLFTNSIDNELNGVVAHRNFSLNFGLRKSIDIAQPRVKYHNMKLICFSDLNGDGIRDDNEPLLSNIKIKISKNLDLAGPNQARFGEQELVTDPNGELEVVDLPEGNYLLDFKTLENLGTLYNKNGNTQDLLISENTTLYIPYVESYRVKGRVVLKRDEYSSLGLINANGIRVMAIGLNGDVYSALTDSEGHYSIDIPQGGAYTIKVNNIFGEEFEIDKEEFIIHFNGFTSFNVDFTFFESKRKMNLKGENLFEFRSLNESGE